MKMRSKATITVGDEEVLTAGQPYEGQLIRINLDGTGPIRFFCQDNQGRWNFFEYQGFYSESEGERKLKRWAFAQVKEAALKRAEKITAAGNVGAHPFPKPKPPSLISCFVSFWHK